MLNLEMCWTDGDLQFWDPVVGGWQLRRVEERTRAEAERVGRLEERARADAAESRIAELEAELRQLRGR